jgi:hypothetical protein
MECGYGGILLDGRCDMTECETCEYYDPEEGICGAFECNGTDCPTLPCEET